MHISSETATISSCGTSSLGLWTKLVGGKWLWTPGKRAWRLINGDFNALTLRKRISWINQTKSIHTFLSGYYSKLTSHFNRIVWCLLFWVTRTLLIRCDTRACLQRIEQPTVIVNKLRKQNDIFETSPCIPNAEKTWTKSKLVWESENFVCSPGIKYLFYGSITDFYNKSK